MQAARETEIEIGKERERVGKGERQHVVRWHFVGNKHEHLCTVNCHQLNGRQWGTPKKMLCPVKRYQNLCKLHTIIAIIC